MHVEVRMSFRRTARLLRNDRAFRRAVRKMPRPVPWDWAAPRLMPLLAGPRDDEPGETLVRATAELGCAVEFGVDLGGHFPMVDELVAERWEMSPSQLFDTALANLRRRTAALDPSTVRTLVRSGRVIRALERPLGCASSLLLAPEAVVRLFGGQDQVFAAPGRHKLVSFPIDMPEGSIAEIAVDMEMDELLPLFLQPFALVDGKLLWVDGPLDEADDYDE